MSVIEYDKGLRMTNYMTYIEPNYTAKGLEDQDGNPIQMTHDLEDYCVAVDLCVEVRGRNVASTNSGGITKYILHWDDNKGNSVNFLSGSKMGFADGKDSHFLTCVGSEVFINDIKQKNDSSCENLGIQSISIQYNHWMVPEVHIQFVDIRGGALYQPEELRNHNAVNGMQGLADDNIPGSIYKAFHTFPYPVFTITVKGFYGEPVSYRLSPQKINSKLDSSNGNFIIDADFVGYSFSFLNDIPLNMMFVSPNSTMGAAYWANRNFTLDGFGDDGNPAPVPMPKMNELIDKVKNNKENLEKMSNENPVKQNYDRMQEQKTALAEVYKAITNVERELKEFQENSKSIGVYDESVYIALWDGTTPFDGEDKVVSALITLKGKIKRFNEKSDSTQIRENNLGWNTKLSGVILKTSNGLIAAKTYTNKKVPKSFNDLLIKEQDEKRNNLSSYNYVRYISLAEAKADYDVLSKHFNDETSNATQKMKDVMVGAMTSVLGFVPSVENITKIMLAHMETLFSMIMDTAEYAAEKNRNLSDMGMSERMTDVNSSNPDGMVVPPFPHVSQIKDEGLSRNQVDAWIGDVVRDRNKVPEIDLINGLLNGVKILAESINGYTSNNGVLTGKVKNIWCPIPITPLDFLLTESPFGNDIDFNDWGDVSSRLFRRWLQLDIPFIKINKYAGESYATMCHTAGVIDAYNLSKCGKLSNDAIMKLEGLTGEKTYDIIVGKDGDYQISNQTDLAMNSLEMIQGYKSTKESCSVEQDCNDKLFPTRVGEFGMRRLYWDDEYWVYENTKRALYSQNIPMYNEKNMLTSDTGTKIQKYINFDVFADSSEDSKETEMWRYKNLICSKETKSAKEMSILMPVWESDDFYKYGGQGKSDMVLPEYPDVEQYNAGKEYYNDVFTYDQKYLICGNSGGVYNRRKPNGVGESDREFGFKNDFEVFTYEGLQNIRNTHYLTHFTNSNKKETAFGIEAYYRQTTNEAKALIFLTYLCDIYSVGDAVSTAQWIRKNEAFSIISTVILQQYHGTPQDAKMFMLIPKAMQLLCGAWLWKYTTGTQIGKESSGETWDVEADGNWFENLWSSLIERKDIEGIRDYMTEKDSDFLIENFKEWANSDDGFVKIDREYALKNNNGKPTTESDIKEIKEIYKQWKNKKLSGVEFLTKLTNKLDTNFFRNYERIEMINDDGELLLVNRFNTEIIKEVTDLVFKPVALIKPFLDNRVTYIGPKNTNLTSGGKRYFQGVIDGLKYINKDRISGIKTGNVPKEGDPDVPVDVKIQLYKSIKQLYDRWLGSIESRDKFTLDALLNGSDENFTSGNHSNHFFFIDSFYNKIGHCAYMDIGNMIERVIRSQSIETRNFLEFFYEVLQENRLMLICVPNFLDMSNDQNMMNMFRPVPYIEMQRPDDMDDFVIMYCPEFSSKLDMGNGEYADDSYMITDTEDNLPVALTSRNPVNGYKIPCFGVTYGGQYQSYFTDIQVGMDSNMVTEQSIKAQFMLADMAQNEGGAENGRNTKYLGQNLYTVYSNNAYTCTVTMLGCAWIRPTMYFALMNVPMFRGTYQIMKVTHQISAGKMTTTFVGNRMAKWSTPLVESSMAAQLNSGTQLAMVLSDMKSEKGTITNDCGYKKFPMTDYTSNNVTEEFLRDTKVADVAKSDAPKYFGSDVTLLEALLCTLNAEAGNQDELGRQLVATVFYNRWRKYNGDWNKLFKKGQIAFSSPHAQPSHVKSLKNGVTYKELENIIIDIFTKTPECIVGKTTKVTNPVEIYVNNAITTDKTKPKQITLPDVQKIFMYCTTKGYSPANTNDKKNHVIHFEKLESQPSIWRSCEYICHHEGHVFTGGPSAGVESSKKWSKKPPIETDRKPSANEMLYYALANTVEFTEALKGITMEKSESDGVMTVTRKGDAGDLAIVFDILLSTYNMELASLYWVSEKLENPSPDRIEFSAKGLEENQNRRLAVGIKHGDTVIQEGFDSWPLNYKISVSKRYGGLIATANASYAEDSDKNYMLVAAELTSVKPSTSREDMTALMNVANENVADCPVKESDVASEVYDVINNSNYDIIDGYTWDGNGNERNLKTPIPVPGISQTFNVAAAVQVCGGAAEGGNCAGRVRDAFNKGGLVIDGEHSPWSACKYVYWMSYYGFHEIASGVSPGGIVHKDYKQYPNGMTPKAGDVMIIAGKSNGVDKDKHGHIQIYDGSDGKWKADKTYNTVFVYQDRGRPYKVYRHKSQQNA